MKNTLKKVALTAALLGSISAAQAGFVTLDAPGTAARNTIDIVGSNNFKDILKNQFGVKQYELGSSLATDSAGTVTYYYMGKEAGYNNVFTAGSLSKETGFAPSYQDYIAGGKLIGDVSVSGGILDFGFCAFDNYGKVGCQNNSQNDKNYLGSLQSMAYSLAGNIAWLFWDDSGAGPDDNHDDMIIKAVFTPRAVPEPATLGLLGLGLLGVWFTTRRRNVKA